MIQNTVKIVFLFLIIGASLEVGLSAIGQTSSEDTGLQKGLKIVLVVDVSASLKKEHRNLIEEFVLLVHDSLQRPDKDDIHLITFSEYAKISDSVQIRESIKTNIRNEFENEKTKQKQITILKHGLEEVFGLVENEFPQKVGIVLFISDGRDESLGDLQKNLGDLKRIIKSLGKNGFKVFSIFIPSDTTLSSRENMKAIATWADTRLHEIKNSNDVNSEFTLLIREVLETKYSSPVSRDEFVETIDSLESQLRVFGYIISILAVIVILIVILGVWRIISSKKLFLGMLWGKLEYTNESGEKVIINLSEKLVDKRMGCPIKTPDDFPNIDLFPDKRNRKKVISVRPEIPVF